MAEPTTPLTASEVDELVQRMHQATKAWRPLLVTGLVLVVAGFAVLAGYLEYERRRAQETVELQAAQIDGLNTTLASSRVIIGRALSKNVNDPDWNALERLIGVADRQVTSLNQTLDDQATGPTTSTDTHVGKEIAGPAAAASASAALENTHPPRLARLFIHIQDPEQRPAAEVVAAAWAGQRIGEMTVVVPGIELVRSGSDNTLRCTKVEACRTAGPVLDWINNSLSQPTLRKVDLSRTYEKNPSISPGTYEVWFAPGPIVLKGDA